MYDTRRGIGIRILVKRSHILSRITIYITMYHHLLVTSTNISKLCVIQYYFIALFSIAHVLSNGDIKQKEVVIRKKMCTEFN